MQLRELEIENKSDMEFVEKLYIESFPINERRPVLQMDRLVQNENKFQIFLVVNDEQQRVGFISTWTFDCFIFLEHFAIGPEYRNEGYGRETILSLIESTSLPLIGEIELPESSEFAARRLTFYEKLGFHIWDVPYQQPAYEKGYEPIPMLLISYRDINMEKEFEEIKQKLYSNVYQTSCNN